MNNATAREQVIVIHDHLVHLLTDEANRPESISVVVTVDGRRLRGWEEPGWRSVAVGMTTGALYWWSARRLVLIALESQTVVDEVSYDEDILFAFHLGDRGWLVIGETSVSIVSAGATTSRMEFDDTITTCLWKDGCLAVTMSDDRAIVMSLEADGLQVRP